jgi:hypothetical protein
MPAAERHCGWLSNPRIESGPQRERKILAAGVALFVLSY